VTAFGVRPRLQPLVWPLVIVVFALAFYLQLRHKRDLVDFQVYRTAASRALAAEPLYRADDEHWQFKYLPAFAFAMAPFAVMRPEVARVVWFTMSVGLLVAFLRLCAGAVPEPRLSRSQLVWITALLLGKCFVKDLIFGQTNVLLGLISMAALLAARRHRPAAAGALVALAVFVKPYALILVPWLALALGLPALAGFAAALAAGLALPIATYGWHGNLNLLTGWYRTVTDTTAPNLFDPENISFTTMWAKWIGATRAAHLLGLATTVAAMAMVGAAGLMRRRVRQPDYLEFGLLLLLVPLISPQGWDYVLLLGTPLVMCLIDRWALLPLAWRLPVGTSLLVIGFTIFDLIHRALYVELMHLSAISVAALVCAACGLYLRQRALA
jgi:hypothetical protein